MQNELNNTDEVFEAALAVGTEAEDFVYEWLKQNYSYVQDSRYQTRDKGTGPRLVGKEGSVILPDFIIYDKFRGKWAIDVKSKTSVYTIGSRKYFTVDEYKFNHYMKTVELMDLDGLMLIFRFEGKLFVYKADERRELKHWFHNSYSSGASYLFEYRTENIKR